MSKDKIKEIMNRSPRKILDKSECYLLYESGIFGNKAVTWNSYREILESGWTGEICMRSKKGVARKQVRYNLKLEDVPKHIKQFAEIGIPENMIGFNQSMPDEKLVLQGEFMTDKGDFYLLGTTIRKPMNPALEEKSFTLEGDVAREMLVTKLSVESFCDLTGLLKAFPTSVIEFSAYKIPVGNMAETGRNTVFWEVRNY